MSSVLACDPDELQATAHGLRRAAAALDAAAGELSGGGDMVWRGLAALEHAARRAEAADRVRRLATPLEQVAGGLVEVAEAAREHGDTVRRHSRLRDEADLELARMLALGAPSEPLAAVQWSERTARLEQERSWHQRLVDRAELEFDRVQRTWAEAVERVREALSGVVTDLAVLAVAAQRAFQGYRQVTTTVAMADTVRRVRRMPVPGGERTTHRMNERVLRHLRRLKLQPPGWLSRVPGGAAVVGRAAPVMVVPAALRSVVDGGGYEGWRGGTTRIMGGVALAGLAVAALPAVPVAGAVAVGSAAAYQAWMTGNWLWDNRERIRSAASRTWSKGRSTVSRVWSQGRGLVSRARERVGARLDRLRQRLGQAVGPPTGPVGAQA